MADDGRGNEARSIVGDDPDAGGGLRSFLLAALRRLLVLIVVAAALTAIGSLIIGALLGSSLTRSLAVGFYIVGSFWLVSGFFVGNRGPVRLKSDFGAPLFGSRFVRWATPEEREETINMSALYVLLGFVLILFGFVADTRYSLF
jgi:hypothetical protein